MQLLIPDQAQDNNNTAMGEVIECMVTRSKGYGIPSVPRSTHSAKTTQHGGTVIEHVIVDDPHPFPILACDRKKA